MRKTSRRQPSNNRYYHEDDLYDVFPNKEIKRDTYKDILRTFFYEMTLQAIEEGTLFRFPKKLGVFGVFKTKTKPKMIDFNHLRKTGEKRKVTNMHSHGFMTKTTWKTEWPLFDIGDSWMNNVYKFKLTRDWSRFLASKIKNDNTIFKYYDY